MPTPKITLITPPDIFQNEQSSIMLIDLTVDEQEQVSAWFSKNLNQPINLYYYQGEDNIPWLLYSQSISSLVYINLDNWSTLTSYYASYFLSKPNVYWSTDNLEISKIFQHISVNRVNTVLEFLERTFNGESTS